MLVKVDSLAQLEHQDRKVYKDRRDLRVILDRGVHLLDLANKELSVLRVARVLLAEPDFPVLVVYQVTQDQAVQRGSLA